MDQQQLVDLFSKPPASMVWTTTDDGRQVGQSTGLVLELAPGRAEVVAWLPPGNLVLIHRNTTMLTLLLCALFPDWPDPAAWLAEQMRAAASYTPTAAAPHFEAYEDSRRVRFMWLREQRQATLKVTQ